MHLPIFTRPVPLTGLSLIQRVQSGSPSKVQTLKSIYTNKINILIVDVLTNGKLKIDMPFHFYTAFKNEL